MKPCVDVSDALRHTATRLNTQNHTGRKLPVVFPKVKTKWSSGETSCVNALKQRTRRRK